MLQSLWPMIILRYKYQDRIYKYYVIFKAGNMLIMRFTFSYLNITGNMQFNRVYIQIQVSSLYLNT